MASLDRGESLGRVQSASRGSDAERVQDALANCAVDEGSSRGTVGDEPAVQSCFKLRPGGS